MAFTYSKEQIDQLLAGITGVPLGGIWNWSGAGNSNPSWGAVSADDLPESAEFLYIYAERDAYNQPVESILNMLDINCEIWGQSVAVNTSWVKYNVTGPAVVSNGVATIPVSQYAVGATSVNDWEQVRLRFVLAGA